MRYNDIKCSKSTPRTGYSASTSGREITGAASAAVRSMRRQRQHSTARTSWDGARRTPALNHSMLTLYAMDATDISAPTRRSITIGSSSVRDRMSWISLGWRVTPTAKKTGH